MKKLLSLFLLSFLSGCASQNPLTDFRFQTQVAPPYILASWHNITQTGNPIRIYIEGDGNAFDSNGNPTDNPTPKSTFLREIAANDPNPNVAYLGRPCQYIQAGPCSQNDWTTGRFSAQTVQSANAAVTALMEKAKTDQIILIGYSGGAQMAGLIAVRNPAVKKVITIAGVLDTEAWTTYHHDTPLTNSLNLKNEKESFEKIPQIHYVGLKDRVVPAALTKQFVTNPAQIVEVKKATHTDGFSAIIPDIYKQN